MNLAIPTPATLPRRHPVAGTLIVAGEDTLAEFRGELQSLGLMYRSGVGDDPAPIATTCSHPALLGSSVQVGDVIGLWLQVLEGKRGIGVVDYLALEFWFSLGYSRIITALPPKLKYSKTLLTIRQRAGISLHDHARNLTWRNPVTHVASLKMARAYLRDAVGHESATQEGLRREFTGRLGVASILISRFEAISAEEAAESYQALLRSIDQGNDPVSALPYLVEASVVRYDLDGDADELNRALLTAESMELGTRGSPGLLLAKADAYLRLMDASRTVEGRSEQRERLDHLLDAVARETRDPEHLVRRAMLLGVLDALESGGPGVSPIRGARIPFGYRQEPVPHQALLAAAPFVLQRLEPLAMSGEPLATGVLADIIIESQDSLGIDLPVALRRVIDLRARLSDGDNRALLLRCHDMASLAYIEGDEDARRDALLKLAALVSRPITAAPALILLAKDVEEHGSLSMPIVVGTPAVEASALRHVANGDSYSLWSMAAELALIDANLATVSLGGRSGVTSVGDYYGLSVETLVYKRMNRLAVERERARASAIHKYLAEHKLTDEFGVTMILATCEPSFETEQEEVIATRRFVTGRSVHEFLADMDHATTVRVLGRVASFLGHINLAESSECPVHVRRELKAREMGRWLRVCGLPNPGAAFDQWFERMQLAGSVRRRDAHLFNWLLAEDGRIVAMDLEAQGWRPAGYDLAQVTDDHDYLDIADWAARRSVFDAYRSARSARDDTQESEWVAYQAGVLSRLVRGMTDPTQGPFRPGIAEGRLHGFRETVEDRGLKELSDQVLQAWLGRRGLTRLPRETNKTAGAGRIRLSKAMAFHLRHNEALGMDEGGWTTLDHLANAIGQGYTSEELATVATDPREPRFEIGGARIRARYGHSVSVAMDCQPPKKPVELYHASPWSNARDVLDKGQGLRRGQRQFVHLTDSIPEAVANGVRDGHPLLYTVQSDDLTVVLAAGRHTYLADAIPSGKISVVPMTAYWSEIPPVTLPS